MFISVTFPLADFRDLHKEKVGRLERPAWGRSDPQAQFARGMGSIHTRTKSGNGFIGENYYADCNNLIKYPDQFFLNPIPGLNRRVLAYPFYRRFYYDGLMSGRFELGFRLNEGSIEEIELMEGAVEYDAPLVARELLNAIVRVELSDGRIIQEHLHNASDALRDGWLLSSTKQQALSAYPIAEVGGNYVGVGEPFVFIRSGRKTQLLKSKQARTLFDDEHLNLFATRSGLRGQNFDMVVNQSRNRLDSESAKERVARLFYSQIRTLAYAHSFYLRQIARGKISGGASLEPAVRALVDRLMGLAPLDDQPGDQLTCAQMQEILRNADVDTSQMAMEIEGQVRPGWFRRKFGGLFGYFDKKVDIAIGAAAEAATTKLLSSGP